MHGEGRSAEDGRDERCRARPYRDGHQEDEGLEERGLHTRDREIDEVEPRRDDQRRDAEDGRGERHAAEPGMSAARQRKREKKCPDEKDDTGALRRDMDRHDRRERREEQEPADIGDALDRAGAGEEDEPLAGEEVAQKREADEGIIHVMVGGRDHEPCEEHRHRAERDRGSL
ncbi:MAG: hypothetical protein FJX67_11780 [Alphaproteobacteria bacterium]|nr:hypothetical protein [Alphaproteobacteria bacterium]